MALDFEKLQTSDHLLNLLIQMEDVLDRLDIYVYPNWIDGEVVEGPAVRPHFISWSLRYPEDKMPDPRAIRRLMQYGITMSFDHVSEAADGFNAMKRHEAETSALGGVAADPSRPPEAAEPASTAWIVRMAIPRRLLQQFEKADLELYADEVDPEDVSSAKDSGLNDESEHLDADAENDTGTRPDAGEPGASPMGASPMGADMTAAPAAGAPRGRAI